MPADPLILGTGAWGDLDHPDWDRERVEAEGNPPDPETPPAPRSQAPYLHAWVTGWHYEPGQIVAAPDGTLAMALLAHDAGVYATDLAANRWKELGGGSGGAALKYGRFTATLNSTNQNVEAWAVSDTAGTTDLDWVGELGGFVLNEPGLYACHATAQVDTGITPIDQEGVLQLGYSGNGSNGATPIPLGSTAQPISCAMNFLFSDSSQDSNEIYVSANFDTPPTDFASVAYELVVVRLGDAPAGALQ